MVDNCSVGNMDALNSILVLILIAILFDSIRGLVTKSPPYLIAPFVRFWRETAYLRNILHDKRFAQWKPETARYVALCAIKAQSGREMPRPVLDLLQESLKRGEPVILLGEPGAGKTTALEALTYRLARRAYRWNILLWFLLLLIAVLLSRQMPSLALLWLASFSLWEALARRLIVPIFLEARSDYIGGEVKGWIENVLKAHLGTRPLLGSYRRAALLVDGVNEVRAGLYETFVEGWRSFLREQRRAILTSRTGEAPSERLEGSTVLTICDLDDAGVREFLEVYGREKARVENRRYTDEDVHRDFEELRNKNLLGERDIGRNPYWLKMVVESGLYTPNRGALLRKFAERLIRREIKEKPEERKRRPEWKIVPLEVEMDALGRLALAMHREQRIGYTGEKGWETARGVIRAALGDLPYKPDDILGEAESATLLRIKYKERVEFVHQLVQEFFAAWALRKRWQEALNHAEDVRWWEILFLLGGLVYAEDVDAYCKLVKQTLGKGKNTQCLFVSIGLLRSVSENPPEDISEEVINRFASPISRTLTAEQRRAARELERILGQDTVEAYGLLLNNRDPHIRVKGLVLLTALQSRRSVELLANTLHKEDEDVEVRRFAAEALGKIGNESAIEHLIKAIDDDLPDVRCCVIDALGKIRDPRAVEPLIAKLGDSEADVRWRAARALGKIGDARAIDSLITALCDQNANVRRHAAEALRNIGVPAVPLLVASLHDPDAGIRRSAVEVLGKIGDSRAVDSLITALRDRDVGVRKSAAEALGKIGDARAVKPLIGALRDQDTGVRRSAAEALGKIGNARAVKPLIGALRDQDTGVRRSAAEALGKIGDASAVKPLITALRDQDTGVRRSAAEALGKIGDARAVKSLISVLRDSEASVQRRAAEALEKIGEPSIKPLIAELRAPETQVRWFAVDILGRLGDARALPELERVAREDKDVFVADAARKAIARIRQRADKA
jgi:HEAT repeat protein/energy-coupling factor transporter ATP-binding protein EcfA2